RTCTQADRAAHYARTRVSFAIIGLAGRERPGRRERPPPARLLLLGRDHHDHLAAFQARPGLDHDVLAEVGLDARGHAAAQLLVAHLAATEADVDLDLVPFFEELAHLAQLDLVVALVGHRKIGRASCRASGLLSRLRGSPN